MALTHEILESDSLCATVRFVNEQNEIYIKTIYGDVNDAAFAELIETHKRVIEERAANGIIKFVTQ